MKKAFTFLLTLFFSLSMMAQGNGKKTDQKTDNSATISLDNGGSGGSFPGRPPSDSDSKGDGKQERIATTTSSWIDWLLEQLLD